MRRIALGLWGDNGHQIDNDLESYPQLDLIAVGGLKVDAIKSLLQKYPNLQIVEDFDALMNIQGIEMISLCSEYRSDQAGLAIKALERDIHVYAEKPCALNEEDLDRIVLAAKKSKAIFHEMVDTLWEEPYWTMRQIVQSGQIGEVVQVLAQKQTQSIGSKSCISKVS